MNCKDEILTALKLPEGIAEALSGAARLFVPRSLWELREMSMGFRPGDRYLVRYPVPGLGEITEAEVVRCKNGLSVNFPEDAMRRRDPDCMLIGDEEPSDKPRFRERMGYDFSRLRHETLEWLSRQELLLLPFQAGSGQLEDQSLLICPANAAFFALALAELQGFLGAEALRGGWEPRGIILLAPPFRHSHFGGRQAVVHRRSSGVHEIFAYNLYPGPSAKKGVFSLLLDRGEREGWICCHASAVECLNQKGARRVFLHEGASGGGKSEMLQPLPEGELLLAKHPSDGRELRLRPGKGCSLRPIADDMALARTDKGCLMIRDAEAGWFLRLDGLEGYGTDPELEKLCIEPDSPLLFFNLDGKPGATCLPWEPVLDSDGKPCSNPRVILPRSMRSGVTAADREDRVHWRSFGVRTPPSSRERPDYGVLGLIQFLPPALAWLWRLISPRGYRNPSIGGEQGGGLRAEGVGSYWPFSTGRRVDQANLLLHQILDSPETRQLLIPNQHIGVWQLGFAGQWLCRELLAKEENFPGKRELLPARCPLLGYAPDGLSINGQAIPDYLLRPELQPELGEEGYDAGARLLTDFFRRELPAYLTPELDPRGKRIIEAFLDGAKAEDYQKL